MKFKNLSDGTTDGFALFYMKDGLLHAVGLAKDQATMLDILIPGPFMGSKVHVANTITVEDGVIKC